MSKFIPGDQCIVTSPGLRPERAVVEKVGRLYITTRWITSSGEVAARWSRRRFYIESGLEKTEYVKPGHLLTVGEWDALLDQEEP